ncbi:hypothetical protein IG631_08246 [Alternaria alternata]|nr:hypothetical protein IG631_08246 [Alternaria alternata]
MAIVQGLSMTVLGRRGAVLSTAKAQLPWVASTSHVRRKVVQAPDDNGRWARRGTARCTHSE